MSLSEGLGRRLPFGERSLDLLVIARPEAGEIDAIPAVLERFPPAGVLWAGPGNADRQAAALQLTLAGSGIPVTLAQTGMAVDLGKEACLRVLFAGKQGAVLLLEWDRFRALFPIGLDLEGLKSLENGRMVGNVTALMLSDGGYAPANPPEWIKALNPRLLLLSVDPTSKRRLPSPETLEAAEGYPLLRTDRNGWIHITTDGERMWVEAAR